VNDLVSKALRDEPGIPCLGGILEVGDEGRLLLALLASKTTPAARVSTWGISGDRAAMITKFLAPSPEIGVTGVVRSLVIMHSEPLTDSVHRFAKLGRSKEGEAVLLTPLLQDAIRSPERGAPVNLWQEWVMERNID